MPGARAPSCRQIRRHHRYQAVAAQLQTAHRLVRKIETPLRTLVTQQQIGLAVKQRFAFLVVGGHHAVTRFRQTLLDAANQRGKREMASVC